MIQQNALQRDDMQLGRYRLLKRVGRGGMGEVWLAEDPQLHRQVAIKMLPPQKQYDEEDAALFEREAQVVASLNHPHVLPVHDYGEQRFPDGQVINYLVMPYISGGSLDDLVERRTASGEGFHYREALSFLMQAAEAIDYAHTKGMIHRDIKPANMLLRSEGSLLLADFGIALMVSRDDDSEEAGAMVGTPLYIAPEQAQARPTAASDLYSLAVIAYLFVTGRHPFQAETTYATIVQHIVQAPPSPRQWNADLSTECEVVLLRGLAKKPEERYPTARDFVSALMRSLGAEDMLPASLLPPSPAASVQDDAKMLMTRRNVLIGSAAGAVVLSGTIGGIWALTHRPASPQTAKTSSSIEKPAMVLRDLKSPPSALLWIPGKHILTTTCSDESAIKLWDIDSFRIQNLPEYESTYTANNVTGAAQSAWSQDGKYLAVVNFQLNDDKNLYINIYFADLKSQLPGFEKGIQVPSTAGILGISWLANRYVIAVWSDLSPNVYTYIGMWDIEQLQLRPQPLLIKANASLLRDGVQQALAVSPDGTSLALALSDHVLLGKPEIVDNRVIWKQDQPNRLIGQLNHIDEIAWAGNGKQLLGIASNLRLNYVFGWDLTQQPDDRLRFGIPMEAAEFSSITAYPKADKGMFAAGTSDGKIYIWNGQARKLPVRTLASPAIQKPVRVLAWSHDAQWLAASYADDDVTILIWKI